MDKQSIISFYLLFTFLLCLLLPLIKASESQFKLDGRMLELDDSNFDAAISTFDYLFVHFYSPRCRPSNKLTPELDKAAPMLAGLKQPIVVAKYNAHEYRKIAKKLQIDGYPTLKLFMHGVPTDYYGLRKADLLVQSLTKLVAPDVAFLTFDSSLRDFTEAAGTNFPIFVGPRLNESKDIGLDINRSRSLEAGYAEILIL